MNTKKTVLATLLAALAVSPLAVTTVNAQHSQYYTQVQAPAAHMYTQAELDQMLAPIALYPDALLSQVLMAATYPIEVREAARWSRANPGLQGDEAVREVHYEDWDPSVKSLVAFPQILLRMDENHEWTRALGDAFLAQEPQLMDQVQRLRQRAERHGYLRSDEQIHVVHEGPVIVVRPARLEYLYVPYYDPLVVYGNWWWPEYRPVYWAPWPGYARPRPSHAFWWGRPIGISLNFFFGDFDWGRRHVRVAHNSYYYRQPVYYSRAYSGDRARWQHDPHHRRTVEYRHTEVRQRFATAQMERREVVREERPVARQLERRMERQAAPAAIATPTQPAVQPRVERREESRAERREDRREDRRDERQARQQVQPPVTLQAQPQLQPVTPTQRVGRRDESRMERREDKREERRAERQAAPTPTLVQPAAQPRAEQRDDRRAERQAAEAARQAQDGQRQAQEAAQRQAQQQAQRQAQQQAQQAQRQAQQQAQEAAQRQAQQQAQQQARQAQQQARPQQPAATMPAALPPQTPRAERQEQREERREKRDERREQRKDRDKG